MYGSRYQRSTDAFGCGPLPSGAAGSAGILTFCYTAMMPHYNFNLRILIEENWSVCQLVLASSAGLVPTGGVSTTLLPRHPRVASVSMAMTVRCCVLIRDLPPTGCCDTAFIANHPAICDAFNASLAPMNATEGG